MPLIHEIHQAIWLDTPKGLALAKFIIDRGMDSDLEGLMTKRWSSTVSDLTNSKRQASKAARRAFSQELLKADREPPEAEFDNAGDLLAWLNDEIPESA